MHVYITVLHTSISRKTAPTPWATWNVFQPLYPELIGECIVPCIIILALYLLDLCSFKFSLVQYLIICMKCCEMYPWRAPLQVGEYRPCARIRISITCVHANISLWRTCRLLVICLTCAYFCPNSHIHYEWYILLFFTQQS